ncbi:MAG: GntR family transcriptional regulator [Pseudomonadota bacterium]
MANPLKIDRDIKTLKERALESLREAIINFHFAPGERLVERRLCEQLGVSRSVVREVLRHLESEGLVDSTPHQGPAVAVLDEATALQIYEIRAHLEAIGARACAEQASEQDLARLEKTYKNLEAALKKNDSRNVLRATTAFYETLFACGGKAVAWSILQSLNARITSLRRMTMASMGRDRDSLKEMRAIMTALRARDPERAEAACRAHVDKATAVAAAIFEAKRGED